MRRDTRDPDTQAAIGLAREEPETWSARSAAAGWGHTGAEVDREEPSWAELCEERKASRARDEVPPADSITLTGQELAAYRALRDAAAQAHVAQQTMATTGQALRDAIQKLCAVIAPGTKP